MSGRNPRRCVGDCGSLAGGATDGVASTATSAMGQIPEQPPLPRQVRRRLEIVELRRRRLAMTGVDELVLVDRLAVPHEDADALAWCDAERGLRAERVRLAAGV